MSEKDMPKQGEKGYEMHGSPVPKGPVPSVMSRGYDIDRSR